MIKPTAYVINLERRPERWQKMQNLWTPHLELVRWPATDMPGHGAEGCKRSHIALAEQMLKEIEMLVVLEDDAVPTEWFIRHGMSYLDEAHKHLAQWDYINAGPCIDPKFTGQKDVELSTTSSPMFFKVNFSYRTHFVLYNRASLPMLKAAMDTRSEIDVFLGVKAARHWVPTHVLAVQDNTPSDIRKPTRESSIGYETSERLLQAAIPTACVACYLAPGTVPAPSILTTKLPLIVFSESDEFNDVPGIVRMRASPVPADEPKEPGASNAKFLTAAVMAHRRGHSHMIYTDGTPGDFETLWNRYVAAGKPRAIGGHLGSPMNVFPVAVLDEMFEMSKGGTVAKANSMKSFHHEIAWRLFRDHGKQVSQHIIPLTLASVT